MMVSRNEAEFHSPQSVIEMSCTRCCWYCHWSDCIGDVSLHLGLGEAYNSYALFRICVGQKYLLNSHMYILIMVSERLQSIDICQTRSFISPKINILELGPLD